MKKILSLSLSLAFTLLTLSSCTWMGVPPTPDKQSSVSTTSSPASSSDVASESAIAVALDGTWELVKEEGGETYYFRLTLNNDGTMKYGAGWYASEWAELYEGTYSYDGTVLSFTAQPTLNPEDTADLNCAVNLEIDGDALKISYNSLDKMYFFQTAETESWTKYLA